MGSTKFRERVLPTLYWRTGETCRYQCNGKLRDIGKMVCKSQAREWCRRNGVDFVDRDSTKFLDA